MSLKSGDSVNGPYDVAAQIGAGGMGEVYRATDTHLERPVAIKVLPGSVAADPNRLVRFERESEFSPPSTIRTSPRSTASSDRAESTRW